MADLVEILQQLQIDHFSLLAMSAGTQYGLACSLSPELRHRIIGKVCLLR
jgi:hypothetical protein